MKMNYNISGFGGFVYGEFEYRLVKLSNGRAYFAYRYEDETLPTLYREWHETRMPLYTPYAPFVQYDNDLSTCPIAIEQIQQLLLAN